MLLGLWLMIRICSLNVFGPWMSHSLLVTVLTYGSETMIWREKERSMIRGVLGIRRMDKVLDARIRQFSRVTKCADEKIDEGVLRWFGHVERMKDNMIAERVYVGECAGSCSVDRPRKRWIDNVKNCLKKRGFDVRPARRMAHDRSVWQGFVMGNRWGVAQEMKP